MTKSEILEKLDTVIKGHNEAKRHLISLFERVKIRHYQRMILEYKNDDPRLVPNKNIMLVGKSGTGKTYLVEQIAKIYKIPVYIVDSTELNPAGAEKGIKLETLVKSLTDYATKYLAINKNQFFSVQGVLDQMVVFFDEFDKLGENKGSSDWNRQTQACFLRLLERKIPTLKNLSFVLAGAFMSSNLYEDNNNENKKEMIGFLRTSTKSNDEKDNFDEEIIKAGIIPEVVGRIGKIVKLDKLSKDDYHSILIDIIIPQKLTYLNAMTDIDLEISKDELDDIVNTAYNSSQGIRMLHKQIDDLMLNAELEAGKYDFLR